MDDGHREDYIKWQYVRKRQYKDTEENLIGTAFSVA